MTHTQYKNAVAFLRRKTSLHDGDIEGFVRQDWSTGLSKRTNLKRLKASYFNAVRAI